MAQADTTPNIAADNRYIMKTMQTRFWNVKISLSLRSDGAIMTIQPLCTSW